MNLAEFLSARRPAWTELEALLGRVEQSDLSSLDHTRARRLVDLYRRASADLVQARTYGAGVELAAYLETLVARGYALLYQVPPLRVGRSVWTFFRRRFPETLRREWRAFALALGAFVAGLLLGGITTAFDPEASKLFVPAEHQLLRPH